MKPRSGATLSQKPAASARAAEGDGERPGLRGSRAKNPLFVLSALVHLGLGIGIGSIELRKSQAATAIEIAETAKKREPPPPAKVDSEPVKREPVRPLARRAPRAAPEKAPEPVSAPAPNSALDALPDFGLSLSGGVGGPGLGIPASPGRKASSNPAPLVRRALAAVPVSPGECEGPASKPRPKNVPQPSYSEAARAAGIEGKVRVELTVDESGQVVSVRLLTGLGYGLDEAALAAARRAEFEPALRCGKPARATFVISMRFTAG